LKALKQNRIRRQENDHGNGEAIGLIENKGIVAAVEACDAAAQGRQRHLRRAAPKSAAPWSRSPSAATSPAVRAAVDAGAKAAGRVGEVVSVHVIPRPHGDVARWDKG
jgi:hypothetical protein